MGAAAVADALVRCCGDGPAWGYDVGAAAMDDAPAWSCYVGVTVPASTQVLAPLALRTRICTS